ncbi:hypothetical protein MHYP_G00164970 [Metynnis hypsauchen]
MGKGVLLTQKYIIISASGQVSVDRRKVGSGAAVMVTSAAVFYLVAERGTGLGQKLQELSSFCLQHSSSDVVLLSVREGPADALFTAPA